MAGSFSSVVQIVFPIVGARLPVLLPSEIAWHHIPGVDGAYLWEDQRGYIIQTDAGVRVYSVRETAILEAHPWDRFFDAIDATTGRIVPVPPVDGLTMEAPAPENLARFQVHAPRSYVELNIESEAPWVDALECAPSDVIELRIGTIDIVASETRSIASPWPLASLHFPVLSHVGPIPLESVFLPARDLMAAFRALGGTKNDGATLAFRGEAENVFIFGCDATVIICPVVPVQVARPLETLIPPPMPESKTMPRATVHHSLRALGGTGTES